jgi:Fic family protein
VPKDKYSPKRGHGTAAPLRTPPSAEEPHWPAITTEVVAWTSVSTTRAGALSPATYLAAVLPEIAHLDVHLDRAVQALADRATIEIARFDGEAQGALLPFTSILLRSESAASSQIENVTASAKAVLMAEAGDTSRQNASLVAANTATMRAALELSDHLDGDAILRMHAALLAKSHPEWAGKWRGEQVWIGGRSNSPHNALFVPPTHQRVPAAIHDLVAFMGRADVAPFTRAMIAHAQFETIHPFPDGNGRTGRALIHAMLRNSGVTTEMTVPVSAGLLNDTDRYYDALTAYRLGDVNPIIELSATASFRAIDNGRQLLGELQAHQQRWRSNLKGTRSDAAAWRALDLIMQQPVVDAKDLEGSLDISEPAANTAIKRLTDAGVLSRANAGLRFRKWVAHDIATSLDAFALRAGRRG